MGSAKPSEPSNEPGVTQEGRSSQTMPTSGPSVRPARTGRVLVIDDEVAVSRTIQRLLGDRHDVVILTSGLEALIMLEGGEAFDLVLCDMSMPEVSGIELYNRAVSARPELADRFVFMTGGTFTAAAREFLEKSSNRRIEKPFDVDRLRAIVRDGVERVVGKPVL